jgi:DNA-binding NarL/FixJ family response regulator
VRASLEVVAPDECLAQVQLERAEEGSFVGKARGGRSSEEGLQTAARAAAEALMLAVGGAHRLRVEGVETLETFGRAAVLVYLADQQRDKTQALMGFCVAGADPTRAAALAVLNAANRALDVG